eukprot:3807290-Amphidinium_carterae.1
MASSEMVLFNYLSGILSLAVRFLSYRALLVLAHLAKVSYETSTSLSGPLRSPATLSTSGVVTRMPS